MLISEELLFSYGAETENVSSTDVIFNEGDTPRFYYQVQKGRVKLNHFDIDGKELILAVLQPGLSVCELMLFIDKTYPVNAVALESATIIKLPSRDFTRLLDENPEISRKINCFLSERLYYKYIMLQNNTSLRPEIRIKGALDYHKSFSKNPEKFAFEVPFTRQQLGSMTGLRIETVVRTVKKLEQENYLRIVNRKIYV